VRAVEHALAADGGWPDHEPPRLKRGVRQTHEGLQVVGTKAGLLRDSGKHLRAEFFVIVKRKHEVWRPGMGQCPVRAGLALDVPAETNQGREYTACFR